MHMNGKKEERLGQRDKTGMENLRSGFAIVPRACSRFTMFAIYRDSKESKRLLAVFHNLG